MTEHDERTGTGDDRPWTVAIRDTRLQQYHQLTLCALGLAVMGAIAVFGVATELFPYHSLNHDEGVYLQQAAMLLDGQLVLHPPVEGAFRPWFFVDGGEYLYPKYAPVPAAIFALGLGIGVPRLSLAAIAAAIVFLTHIIASEAFSRRIGLLAAAFMLVSPLFVLNAAVFLPYAPTTALNLAFGAAFLRADRIAERRRSLRYAGLAGAAIGLAFFARPYTAVLFALPFVAYALWTLREGSRDRIETLGVVALFGCCGVVLTLAYNATLTGAPLRFPYEVFAVRDGLGFGTRAMLGYEVTYTPALALRANARVLAAFVTEWIAGGLLGGILALCGLLVFVVRAASRRAVDPRQLTVLGVLLTVSAGNLYFWGNLNILGSLSASGDGLISYLGPYYHFDLLLPVSVLAALGSVWLFDRSRSFLRTRLAPTHAQAALAVVALLLAAGIAGGSFAAGTPHVRANAAVTENYERAYAPVEERGFDDALVFVPGPYGPWLNHPFQYLRNDPGFDGRTVYAQDRGPEPAWALLDAYPERTPYRYRYRGAWTPDPDDTVEPTLRSTERLRADSLAATTRFGAPPRSTSATVVLAADGETARTARSVDGDVTVDWWVANGALSTANASVPVEGPTRAELRVTVVGPQGGTVAYEQELLVRPDGDGYEVVWPPEPQACLAATECDDVYVPDGDYPPFVGVETERR